LSTVASVAAREPDRVALVYGEDECTRTYGELESRSRRIAHLLRQLGLEAGDCLAAHLGNDDDFFDLYWACHRIGLFFAPINWHLHPGEVEYVVNDCDARVLVSHARFAEVAAPVAAAAPGLLRSFAVGGGIPGFVPLEDALADVPPDVDLPDQREGSVMLYSSGTTGRPKGVRRPLSGRPAGDPAVSAVVTGLLRLFGMTEQDRYLSPAPLYHAAPLTFSAAQMRLGSTSVVMRRFDPEAALRAIDRHRITTSQWVPTHFHRLLALPEEVRRRYDVSSLRLAIHAAAPCPIPLKEAMIAWWGDALVEYYAGTEGGGTLIRAADWLAHKGSVGRHWTGGRIHVLDAEGQEIGEPRREGAIYFEAPQEPAARFRYHKDEARTAEAYRGDLFTLGDIGYLDEEGFLYLTDRQSHMIISGGVNVYPQEAENVLAVHPDVEDVAVIGVPDPEMGEQVKAVVVAAPAARPGPALAERLIHHCRAELAHYKCPRSVDFVDALPRTETGKMAKRRLRERYWGAQGRRIG